VRVRYFLDLPDFLTFLVLLVRLAPQSRCVSSFPLPFCSNGEFRMPLCDGCGTHVDEAHIRRRIERLELATRFRPIHIQVLFLDAAPLAAPEDYFYRAAGSAQRSVASQMFFDEITQCIGRKPSETMPEESALSEFQRRGFFLAYAVECPIESPDQLPAAVTRLASTVLLRLNTSYKPKFVAPISQALQPVIPLLQSNGWADRLILRDGLPFQSAHSEDPERRAEFGATLGDRLSKALAHHD
jgi:hypothetical protein